MAGLYHWTTWLILMWDYTCRDTLAASNVLGGSQKFWPYFESHHANHAFEAEAMAAEEIKIKSTVNWPKTTILYPFHRKYLAHGGQQVWNYSKRLAQYVTIIASGHKRARANFVPEHIMIRS